MKTYLLASLLVLIIFSCTSSQYSFQYEEEYDFKDIETFNFHDNVNKLEFIKKENLVLIKSIMEEEFSQKGISKVEEDPDIVVNIFAIAHDQIKDSKYPKNDAYVIQAGSSYIANPAKTTETIMGSLFVDIYDANSNEPIWQATREKIISSDPESNRRILENSIRSMINSFPPKE